MWMAEVEPWEEPFAEEAAKDGIALEPQTFSWASEPGHLAIGALADQTADPEVMQRAEIGVPALEQMFNRMGGLAPGAVLLPRQPGLPGDAAARGDGDAARPSTTCCTSRRRA